MATTRNATTHWEGNLSEGAGQVTLQSSGIGTYDVSWAARAEEANGKTSPEELIAAAHSACFSMALSTGWPRPARRPTALDTSPRSTSSRAPGSPRSGSRSRGVVEGMSNDDFVAAAEGAKANCPVSQALAAVPSIKLDAALA